MGTMNPNLTRKWFLAGLLTVCCGFLPPLVWSQSLLPIEVCPELGLPPLPGGTCADLHPPPPPSRMCEEFDESKGPIDGKTLSEEEFRYWIGRSGAYRLSFCVPLLTETQKRIFDQERLRMRRDLDFLNDDAN